MTMALTNAAQVDTVIRATEIYCEGEILERAEHLHLGLTVGVGISPGTPAKTRFARAGWAWAVNATPKPLIPVNTKPRLGLTYAPLDALGFARATAGFKLGDTLRARNEVHYAYIIAVVGRVKDRRGRWIGSLQAPKGTVEQALRQSELVVTRGRR